MAKQLVQKLAFCGITDAQIAMVLHIDEATLQQRYGHDMALARIAATVHLRQAMYQKAVRGRTAALTWWGKMLTNTHNTPSQVLVRWQSD